MGSNRKRATLLALIFAAIVVFAILISLMIMWRQTAKKTGTRKNRFEEGATGHTYID